MDYVLRAERLANLQLLDGAINNEKRAKLPAEWLAAAYPDPVARKHYCEKYDLGDVPESMHDFLTFYDSRRERLRKRIALVVG